MREYLIKLSTILFGASIFIVMPAFGIYIYRDFPEYRFALIPWIILILSETLPLFYILISLLKKKKVSIGKIKNLVFNVILISITGNIIMFKFAQNQILLLLHIVYIIALFMIYSDIKKIEKIIEKKENYK